MAWATITYSYIICWAQIEKREGPQRNSNKAKTNVPVLEHFFYLVIGWLARVKLRVHWLNFQGEKKKLRWRKILVKKF